MSYVACRLSLWVDEPYLRSNTEIIVITNGSQEGYHLWYPCLVWRYRLSISCMNTLSSSKDSMWTLSFHVYFIFVRVQICNKIMFDSLYCVDQFVIKFRIRQAMTHQNEQSSYSVYCCTRLYLWHYTYLLSIMLLTLLLFQFQWYSYMTWLLVCSMLWWKKLNS